jgi:DNA-binding NarL/FixJ family response regulator
VVAKAARASDLLAAIAAVSRGEMPPPSFDRGLARQRTQRLPADALAILGLRLEGTPNEDIGEVLGLAQDEVISRIGDLLGLLDDDPARADRASSPPAAPWHDRRGLAI